MLLRKISYHPETQSSASDKWSWDAHSICGTLLDFCICDFWVYSTDISPITHTIWSKIPSNGKTQNDKGLDRPSDSTATIELSSRKRSISSNSISRLNYRSHFLSTRWSPEAMRSRSVSMTKSKISAESSIVYFATITMNKSSAISISSLDPMSSRKKRWYSLLEHFRSSTVSGSREYYWRMWSGVRERYTRNQQKSSKLFLKISLQHIDPLLIPCLSNQRGFFFFDCYHIFES